ncbi:hypothetical protein [Olsenella profusa]|uniref:ABC transporter, ATP-binding protein n=1 Tax=Olsenella profusa F0195 TaxID=1125712 RepID=U2TQB9_9ACTN|nr:hypothetical protein [Olsenella profusa]ERL08630.1 hypothetical protein HMPREF1316_0334 [Olsenella profusa F0195]
MYEEENVEARRPQGALAARPFIRARGLSQLSARVKSYENVDIDVAAGTAHAVCAADNSGKTELLLTLAGRMRPTRGTLTVGGVTADTLVGLSHVRPFASLGFFENVNDVEMVLRVHVVASAELGLAGKRSGHAATQAFLEAWDLADVADTSIEELDRYTFDRLGIALGMAHDPRLLVVDDIESSLTEHQSHKLIGELRGIAHTMGTTICCGVTDYDLAVLFDGATCINDDARAQAAAWARKHDKEVA